MGIKYHKVSKMTKRAAFVTGAAGFVGGHLVEQLRGAGWNVTALCLPTDDPAPLHAVGAKIAIGNIRDVASLTAAMVGQPDAVFHVAANTSAWSQNDAAQHHDNVLGTKNVLDVARARLARRFVFTSSISAYGYHPGERIDESTRSNAATAGTHYGKTKHAAEQLVKQAAHDGLSAVILNPVNVLGPHDRTNWTRQLILPVYDGRLRFMPPGVGTWAHVRDVAAAHVAAVDRGASGENYLLGGVEASFVELAQEIERLAGRSPIRRYRVPRWVLCGALWFATTKSWVDRKEPLLTPERFQRAVAFIGCRDDKARRELGYRHTPLAETLADTLRWVETTKEAA
jgi:nucleoside-diphosphate-sugar epimerase